MKQNINDKIGTGSFVIPGQKLGVIEEYIPGRGTYEENGIIYSQETGFVLIDKKTHEVKVFPAVNRILKPKKGDIVFAKVDDVKDKMVFSSIYKIRDRYISMPITGVIFVHKISRNFIRSAKDAFAPGDVVKALVVKSIIPVVLTTNGKGLGVILAFCTNCGHQLIRSNKTLKCPNCGNIENRYLSSDYINLTH